MTFSFGLRREWRALQGVRRVMVVAHPDDETFWGGVTLASERGWGVVCATHRGTRSRRRAFSAAMSTLGVPGAMLDLPDRKEHPPTQHDLDSLQSTLEPLIAGSQVDRVMTHAPDGEYGHPAHKAISSLVASLAGDRLWYFSFDAAVDQSVAEPSAYARKLAAVSAYLGPSSSWTASDRCHVDLGRHERPVPAASYVRPWDLVSTIYATSGMEIT